MVAVAGSIGVIDLKFSESAQGKVMLNVLPTPSSLHAHISPPWASRRCLAMKSPRPGAGSRLGNGIAASEKLGEKFLLATLRDPYPRVRDIDLDESRGFISGNGYQGLIV